MAIAMGTLFVCRVAAQAPSSASVANDAKKVPVILDTDIGDDIDDTWALGLLLKCPELDVRLVVGDHGKSDYRARLIAKFLQTAGRTDVAVGVGPEFGVTGSGSQGPWIEGYRWQDYPGTVHRDGVQAIIDTIMQSDEPVTLIAIGPLPNVAEALKRQPAIAQRARFVGMHGSVRRGYGGSKKVAAEYNVRANAPACQRALSAAWPVVITPLDTCGLVHLTGDKYRRVRDSDDPIAKAIIENYRYWCAPQTEPGQTSAAESRSSTLFDTVAVYLAFRDARLKIEELGIRVTDDGFTVIDARAKKMAVATAWKDMAGFEDMLVDRLTGG
jgi:inosine-uridine nucleoside N-ribohydrolase